MKVSIIGMGRVGSALAFAVVLKELADQLVLVNKKRDVAVGDALDLTHAHLFLEHNVEIRAGGIGDTAASDVVAICASAPWKDNFKSRADAAGPNTRLFEQIIPQIANASPHAKLLIVTNPVDVLTWHAIRLSGFSPRRVMGTGTLVDSARFRELLSESVRIHPTDLRAYVLGEHGPTQFAALSCAEAGGERLEDKPERRRLFEAAREAGLDVFRAKGYTNYAIAMAAAYVIDSIKNDACHTMPLSVRIDGYCGVRDVCLSVPVVVGKDGVDRWLKPELSPAEAAAFRCSAEAVRGLIEATLRPGEGKK